MRKLDRRTMMLAVSAVAAGTSVPSAASLAGNPWAPTELGQELIRRLPAFAEAVYVRVRTTDADWADDYDEDKVAAADAAEEAAKGRINEVVDAITRRRVTELSHLADLAVAYQAFSDRRSDEDDDDRESRASSALAKAILRMAGIPPSMSSMDGVYKKVARAHGDTA